jgi:hypothetical protein
MARVKINWFDGELDKLLNQKDGAVGKYLTRKGNEILVSARARVGVRTGALRASLHMRHMRDPRGQQIWIGSNLHYALAHHEGTKPHVIVPKSGKMLRFVSKGRVVYTHVVNHPGTKANRYLADALRDKL